MASAEQASLPRIKSYIRRQGRLTPGQQDAIKRLSGKYCLESEVDINLGRIFGRIAPRVLEIGFGNGESLAAMAKADPDRDYLGIEVHRPGIGHLLMRLEQQNITNVRIVCHDAVEVLERSIPVSSLAGIHLFFPDPWPKKRHHKRRIVNTEFLALVSEKLVPGGYFHAATDWENYAEVMLELANRNRLLINSNRQGGFSERPDNRPLTKFEQRGLRLGHRVRDLIFVKSAG